MEEWKRVKVEEISREFIKPSSPTLTKTTKLALSLYDQTAAPIPTPTLLFYPSDPTTHQTLDIAHLKASLSQTLDPFYPLAGRYQTWDTIDCNHQGVPFIVTQVGCPLSTVLNFNPSFRCSGSGKLELLSKFYPPAEFALIGSGIQVAIQINVFTCGGFVLGWYHSHKPMDGTSAATFLSHWAARATGRMPCLPDFDAGFTAFPPYPAERDPQFRPRLAVFDRRSESKYHELVRNKDLQAESQTPLCGGSLVVRSFVFKRAAVADLKARASSEQVPNPSRLLAVSAFIWKHLLLNTSTTITPRADCCQDVFSKRSWQHSALGVTVDVRPRTNPPLPKGSIGNLCEMVAVDLADYHADKGESPELPQLVSEIHASISSVKDMIVDYNGENRGEAKIENLYKFIKTITKYMGDFYFLVAWCKSAGFNDVDFGFGKPKWIVPTHERLYKFQSNTILVVDYSDEDDDVELEAWLFLEKNKMKMLASNQDFLNFAFPRF